MVNSNPHRLLARALWNAVADSDIEALSAILAEDVRWRVYGRNPHSGVFVGVVAVIDYLARIGDAAGEMTLDLEQTYDGPGGAVLAFAVHAQRGDRRLDSGALLRMEIVGSRITQVWHVPLDQHAADAFWS